MKFLISRLQLTVFFGLLFSTPMVLAVIETYEFDNDVQRQRYNVFIDELRCPKCQNQNLSGSNSPIAEDLRRELHRMVLEGQQDRQIIDFMVSRYGDFVLYRPPVDKNTILLWGAPVILLLVGLITLVLYVRRQRAGQQVIALDPLRLTADEQARLDQLLARFPVESFSGKNQVNE